MLSEVFTDKLIEIIEIDLEKIPHCSHMPRFHERLHVYFINCH